MRQLGSWLQQKWAWMRRWGGRRWAYAFSALILIACMLGSLLTVWHTFANDASRAAQTPPPRVKMSGIVPPARVKAQRTGRERGSTQMHLSIALRLANEHALQHLLAGQQDPRSTDYHHYLTPQAFRDAYGPSAAAVTSVTSYLQAAGLRVTGVSANRVLIDATGTVSQVEQAFGVTLGQYTLGGHTYYAPDSEPTLPAAIAPLVQNIGGLDNFFHMTPHSVIQHTHAAPGQGSTPHAALATYGPTDLQGAYDVVPLLSSIDSGSPVPGSKGDVAVFELAPYIPSDVTNYRQFYSLPSSPLNPHSVDGAAVTCDTAGSSCDVNGVLEADLDAEVVSGLAPYATQEVYTGPNSTAGVNDMYNQIVTDNKARAITTSWGLCEPYTGQAELVALDNIFVQAQAQGQTLFAAAGDSGTDDCQIGVGATPTVDSPASDPHVLAVGGTTLTLSGSAYGSETVWNSTNPPGSGDASIQKGAAGGGGLSSYFSPAVDPAAGTVFQYGQGVGNQYATGQRQVPDLTADADPNTGYSVYCTSAVDCPGGQWWSAGGTSAATPLWAAIYNDMDVYYSAAASPAGQHIGWGYKVLYQLFANAQTTAPYHDVMPGNNDIDDPSGGPYYGLYPAAPCFDLASGMGSPDAWATAQDIATGVKTAGGGPCGALPVKSLIADGGFENASATWHTFSLRGDQVITTNGPHLGTYAFTPCQSVGCDDRVWQTVTVPAAVHSASLTFWVNGLTTASGGGALCTDHFYVLLAAADGTVFDTANAASTCAYSTSGQYVVKSYDVTSALQAHQGQVVIVMLRATNTNLSPAPRAGVYWHVDDVALNVS